MTTLEIGTKLHIGKYSLKVQWTSETAVGFSFGSQDEIPRSIAGDLKIQSFVSTGSISVAYPCFPTNHCEVSIMLSADEFRAVGGISLIYAIFEALGLAKEQGFMGNVFDTSGYFGIRGGDLRVL